MVAQCVFLALGMISPMHPTSFFYQTSLQWCQSERWHKQDSAKSEFRSPRVFLQWMLLCNLNFRPLRPCLQADFSTYPFRNKHPNRLWVWFLGVVEKCFLHLNSDRCRKDFLIPPKKNTLCHLTSRLWPASKMTITPLPHQFISQWNT